MYYFSCKELRIMLKIHQKYETQLIKLQRQLARLREKRVVQLLQNKENDLELCHKENHKIEVPNRLSAQVAHEIIRKPSDSSETYSCEKMVKNHHLAKSE